MLCDSWCLSYFVSVTTVIAWQKQQKWASPLVHSQEVLAHHSKEGMVRQLSSWWCLTGVCSNQGGPEQDRKWARITSSPKQTRGTRHTKEKTEQRSARRRCRSAGTEIFGASIALERLCAIVALEGPCLGGQRLFYEHAYRLYRVVELHHMRQFPHLEEQSKVTAELQKWGIRLSG